MYFFEKLKLKSKIFLAPMAGYSDAAMREICLDFGAGLTFSEMISAKGLFYNNKNTENLLITAKNESTKAVQLFGNEESVFERVLSDNRLDKYDIIDLNLGCPAKKIVKNFEGSALLADRKRAERILSVIRKNTQKIISAKIRLGISFENIVARDFVKMFEEVGVDFCTIHARVAEQFYRGNADYEQIAKVVQEVKIPIIANGDIRDTKSLKMAEQTGAAGYMIGRAAVSNPTIFSQLSGEKIEVDPSQILVKHFNLMRTYYGDHYALVNIRKFLPHYLGKKHDRALYQLATASDLLTALESIAKISQEQDC